MRRRLLNRYRGWIYMRRQKWTRTTLYHWWPTYQIIRIVRVTQLRPLNVSASSPRYCQSAHHRPCSIWRRRWPWTGHSGISMKWDVQWFSSFDWLKPIYARCHKHDTGNEGSLPERSFSILTREIYFATPPSGCPSISPAYRRIATLPGTVRWNKPDPLRHSTPTRTPKYISKKSNLQCSNVKRYLIKLPNFYQSFHFSIYKGRRYFVFLFRHLGRATTPGR